MGNVNLDVGVSSWTRGKGTSGLRVFCAGLLILGVCSGPAAVGAEIRVSGGRTPDGYLSPMELRVPIDFDSDSWKTLALSDYVCEGISIESFSIDRRYTNARTVVKFDAKLVLFADTHLDKTLYIYLEIRSDAGNVPMEYAHQIGADGYGVRVQVDKREKTRVGVKFKRSVDDFERVTSGANPHLFLKLTVSPDE